MRAELFTHFYTFCSLHKYRIKRKGTGPKQPRNWSSTYKFWVSLGFYFIDMEYQVTIQISSNDQSSRFPRRRTVEGEEDSEIVGYCSFRFF
jgi:hypothetical protein